MTSPVLTALGFHGRLARVWWVPTRLLTVVPLHAAGTHHPGSKDTVLDRAMSSYSTLSEVDHVRPANPEV